MRRAARARVRVLHVRRPNTRFLPTQFERTRSPLTQERDARRDVPTYLLTSRYSRGVASLISVDKRECIRASDYRASVRSFRAFVISCELTFVHSRAGVDKHVHV